MIIIGAPDDVDFRQARDWPLSARCQREHDQREVMITEARELLADMADDELRATVERELASELQAMGGGPPRGFPNARTMTRDELLDYLAEGTVSFVPDIELVYPGAVDPTA